MTVYRIVRLPAHVKSESEAIAAPFDSCFIPCGFLFPESRADLQPYRQFPLSDPFYIMPKREVSRDASVDDILAEPNSEDSETGAFDSTILQITELDELLLDVQGMGMQYTMHTQMGLRTDMTYDFPKTWDKKQSLLINIPVFSEELCQWHYPISTMGYNIANTDPPIELDVIHNYPQIFGYLPNGDLALYWEIAEILADEFKIEIEPIRSSADGTLIIMPGCAEQIKQLVPNGTACETGVIVSAKRDPSNAISFAHQWLNQKPVVLKAATYQYYRLRLPVIHCELDFNPYGEATWGAFGFTSPRLTGFEFKINNNPFARDVPIFSTERGNVIVANTFYERLKTLVLQFGGIFCAQAFPVQRIP
jgi:hypothetical protein